MNANHPDKKFFPVAAENRLREVCVRQNQWLPNPEIASLALIGGYLARVVAEKLCCEGCNEIVEKPKGNAPVDGLIAYQDRGGLKYPTKELVSVLISLKRFVDIVLDYRKAIEKPLETCVERAVNILMDLPILKCKNEDMAHRKQFLLLLCRKFIKPLLSNHAVNITDKNSVAKMYAKKPLSRKVLKL